MLNIRLTFVVDVVVALAFVAAGLAAGLVVGEALGFPPAFDVDEDEAGFTGLFSFSLTESPFGASLTLPERPVVHCEDFVFSFGVCSEKEIHVVSRSTHPLATQKCLYLHPL